MRHRIFYAVKVTKPLRGIDLRITIADFSQEAINKTYTIGPLVKIFIVVFIIRVFKINMPFYDVGNKRLTSNGGKIGRNC